MSAFVSGERDRATRWKRSSRDLPEGARAHADYFAGREVIEGPFGYCLPAAFAEHNLLPSAQAAIGVFRDLGIPWHAGVAGGPANHLLDSQVQCANALAPHMHDPGAIAEMFSDTLPIAEVLAIERDWFLTFEWIGRRDYLGERLGQVRTRGAKTTSADAAIRYRTPTGDVEVALIEWKYTEDYTKRQLSGGTDGLHFRMERYRALWDDLDCPVRNDRIAYGELFREPLYQLFRLQLLADQMERSHELGTQHVRLVVAAPRRNRALAGDLLRWPQLLRHLDRFAVYNTDELLKPGSVAHKGYRSRYG